MRLFTSLFTAAAAFVMTGAPAMAAAGMDRSPDARLARALDGRVPGKPVDCLNQRDIRSTQIIDGKAILYETSNRTLYVNYPESGAQSLNWGDILVTDTHSSQLCSIDIVRLIDQGSHFQSGSVGLGAFIPYTKPSPRRN